MEDFNPQNIIHFPLPGMHDQPHQGNVFSTGNRVLDFPDPPVHNHCDSGSESSSSSSTPHDRALLWEHSNDVSRFTPKFDDFSGPPVSGVPEKPTSTFVDDEFPSFDDFFVGSSSTTTKSNYRFVEKSSPSGNDFEFPEHSTSCDFFPSPPNVYHTMRDEGTYKDEMEQPLPSHKLPSPFGDSNTSSAQNPHNETQDNMFPSPTNIYKEQSVFPSIPGTADAATEQFSQPTSTESHNDNINTYNPHVPNQSSPQNARDFQSNDLDSLEKSLNLLSNIPSGTHNHTSLAEQKPTSDEFSTSPAKEFQIYDLNDLEKSLNLFPSIPSTNHTPPSPPAQFQSGLDNDSSPNPPIPDDFPSSTLPHPATNMDSLENSLNMFPSVPNYTNSPTTNHSPPNSFSTEDDRNNTSLSDLSNTSVSNSHVPNNSTPSGQHSNEDNSQYNRLFPAVPDCSDKHPSSQQTPEASFLAGFPSVPDTNNHLATNSHDFSTDEPQYLSLFPTVPNSDQNDQHHTNTPDSFQNERNNDSNDTSEPSHESPSTNDYSALFPTAPKIEQTNNHYDNTNYNTSNTHTPTHSTNNSNDTLDPHVDSTSTTDFWSLFPTVPKSEQTNNHSDNHNSDNAHTNTQEELDSDDDFEMLSARFAALNDDF